MRAFYFVADKLGTAFLWCAYFGFEISIIAGAALYFAYHYVKSKVKTS